MATQTYDLYIYLTKRDKSGVRIIAKLTGVKRLPLRLTNAYLRSLNLPTTWYSQINNKIYENRMLWEPWIQSAETFNDLKVSLKKQGYKNIPASLQPELKFSMSQQRLVNTSYLPKNNTMIRKA